MKMVEATEIEKSMHADLCQLIKRYVGEGGNEELALAIASQITGAILATQKPGKFNVQEALSMIYKNIEIGNQRAIESESAIGETKGSA